MCSSSVFLETAFCNGHSFVGMRQVVVDLSDEVVAGVIDDEVLFRGTVVRQMKAEVR